MKSLRRAALGLVLAGGIITAASAHDVWITSEGSGAETRLVLTYGHPPDDLARPERSKLFALDLVTATVRTSILGRVGKGGDRATAIVTEPLGVDAAGAVVAAHYDNGFWSRIGRTSYNTNMLNVPGTERAIWSQKFAKILLPGGDGKAHTQAVGHLVELVPLESPWSAGKTLRVRALLDGKPMADSSIIVGDGVTDKAGEIKTDAEGVASVVLEKGRWHVLALAHSAPSRASALAKDDAYVATLSFGL